MRSSAPTPAELNKALYHRAGKRNLTLEADVQRGCLDWLNLLPGVRCWRQNTGGMERLNAEGKKRYVAFGQPGQADITGLGPFGCRIEIEVKKPNEKPSEEQYVWLHFIGRHGGIAFYADSLPMCVAKLREAYEERGWTWRRRWEV